MERKINQTVWREKAFLDKLQAAAVELNATSHRDIESLKFRDSTGSNDYRELLIELNPLEEKEIQGNYQGKAWKLTDIDGNSVIIVEHETGLEIIYVAGAIASIVGLIPIIVNTWNRVRDNWPSPMGRFGIRRMERRRFDGNGRLIEEPAPPIEAILLQRLLNENDRLNERMLSLEREVSNLKRAKDNSNQSEVKKKRTKRSVKEKSNPD